MFTAAALLAGLSGLCAAPGAAFGADPVPQTRNVDEAERHAEAAFDAHQSGDYAGALELYRRAYDAAPSADILWNLALLSDLSLRDPQLARGFYERYRVHSGALPERIEKASERLRELAELVDVEPHSSVPRSELGARARYWSPARITALVVGATGFAGMIVGTGYGLSALSDGRRARDACAGERCPSQRGIEAAASAASSAVVATITLSVGALAVGAGGILWWSSSQPPSDPSRARAALRLSPVFAHSGAGVQVLGYW